MFAFTFDPSIDYGECYLEVHLVQYMSIWKRTWAAIKYAFGHKSRYGAWDSIILTPEDAIRLQSLLGKFISSCGSSNPIITATTDYQRPLVPSK